MNLTITMILERKTAGDFFLLTDFHSWCVKFSEQGITAQKRVKLMPFNFFVPAIIVLVILRL